MSVGGSSAATELEAMSRWNDWAAPIADDERMQRLERARVLMEEQGHKAVLVNSPASLNYFTGVDWPASERLFAMLLPLSGQPILICPAFERGSLEADMKITADIRLWEEDENPYRLATDALAAIGTNALAVDPELPFGFAERIRASAARVELTNGAGVIDGCRMRKSDAEIALLKQAKAMTLEVHRRIARMLTPGITASAVRTFIDDAHRALGASGASFGIVSFGRTTAYPHGLAEEQRLAEGDVVLIDMGCTIQGYHSDITRTYVFGKPTTEVKRIWSLEKEAQLAAFEAAQPGATCEQVDAAARQVLERAGLGPGYSLPGLPHRTGHGSGLSIHEPAYLVRGDQTRLEAGMCFSNEPTIVIPDRFGVRLEDHFYMTDNGPEWFTQPQPSLENPFP